MPFKKIFKKARKTVKKLIPKEIRAFAPYIAAAYLPPGAVGLGNLNPAIQKAIIAGGTRFATDDEADFKDVGITAALAATPDALSEFGKVGRNTDVAVGAAPDKGLMSVLRGASKKAGESLAAKPFTTMAAQTGIDAASQLAEIQQDELDAYNRRLAEQGITDKTQRRKAIRDIYLGVGYGEDYVDSMLDRYGYQGGGMTMSDEQFSTLLDSIKDDEDEDEMSISEYADMANKGFQQAYGMDSLFDQAPKAMPIRPGFDEGGDVDIGRQFEEFLMKRQRGMQDSQRRRLMEEFEQYMKRQDPTVEAAEGGLMNLGGKEMDLRGGGFVPIGKKEKADDVPARLSKNEFVMTADAVRGAGGGDVNEGARRMYQTMDKLEAMA